jgi:hypothetical protein
MLIEVDKVRNEATYTLGGAMQPLKYKKIMVLI